MNSSDRDRIGDRYVSVPAPLAADATIQDWYDEYSGRFRVAAAVTNPLVGHDFGYQGVFDTEWRVADGSHVTDELLRSTSLPGDRR